MNKNEKRWIVLLVAVVIIAIVLFVALGMSKNKNNQAGQAGGPNNNGAENVAEDQYATQLDDGTRLNNSTNFNSTKTYGNLEISNIQFVERNGATVLLADVKNTGSSAHKLETVKITILGDNDQILAESNAVIDNLEPGESKQINVTFTADVVNARDFTVSAAD